MAEQLTEEQIAELREAFSLWDRAGHGTIPTTDLDAVMHALCSNPSQAELQDMINEADPDGTGTIDFVAFCSLMARKWCDDTDEIMDAFRCFDHDCSGCMTLLDLDRAFKKLGEVFTDEELVEIILEAFDAAMLRGCENYTHDAFALWLREELLPQRNTAHVHDQVQPQQVPKQPQEAIAPSVVLKVEVLKLSGETVSSITIDSAATVWVLSQEIAKLTGVPARLQSLLYAGSVLPPEATLAEVKVVDGTPITLIIRAEVLLEYEPFVHMMMSK